MSESREETDEAEEVAFFLPPRSGPEELLRLLDLVARRPLPAVEMLRTLRKLLSRFEDEPGEVRLVSSVFRVEMESKCLELVAVVAAAGY